MSNRYNRLFIMKPSDNLHEESCPVICTAGILLYDNQQNRIVAQLKFKNLSYRIVDSVTIRVTAYSADGTLLKGIEKYTYTDINVNEGEEFGINKAIVFPDHETKRFYVEILEVRLSEGEQWKLAKNIVVANTEKSPKKVSETPSKIRLFHSKSMIVIALLIFIIIALLATVVILIKDSDFLDSHDSIITEDYSNESLSVGENGSIRDDESGNVSFDVIGISEACYYEVIHLVERYYSDNIKKQYDDLYINYGTEDYDSNAVGTAINDRETRMTQQYRLIYEKYSKTDSDNYDVNNLDYIICGYNYSRYCLDRYHFIGLTKAIGKEPADGTSLEESHRRIQEELDKFYELIVNEPGLESSNEFCVYITKNNKIDYVTTLPTKDIEEIKDWISIHLGLYRTSILLADFSYSEGMKASAYESYNIALDSLQSIGDLLKEYQHFRRKFTYYDEQLINQYIEDMRSYYRNKCDGIINTDLMCVLHIDYFIRDIEQHIEELENKG